MKNKKNNGVLLGLFALVGSMLSASASTITTAEATDAITEGVAFAETIGVASFAIAAVFLVVRIVKKGIRGAA
jgi:hypothetical protein